MQINMTPMIDVVFQLIVFFTATSSMAKSEFGQKVELPVAEKGRDRDESTRKKKITVNVVANGKVYVSGRRTSPAKFESLLRAELAEHAADQVEVQFRADRAAPYGSVEPLLLKCARAGVWQVGFSVKPVERR
jgi:biopolymer transport protein ExbD